MSIQSARQLAEIGAPGAAIGVLAGAMVGGVAALVGLPLGWALTSIMMLAVPLALVGGFYGVLTGLGYAKPGVFAPAAALWFVGFPLSRLWQDTMTPVVLGGVPAPPENIPTFLLYQALVSMGFAIGFIWLYERLIPGWLIQIKDRNPYAERVYAIYIVHAEAMWNTRERRRANRRRAAGQAGSRAATTKVKTKRSS